MRWLCFVVLACAVACAQTPADINPLHNTDPEKALITADDVTLFWKAYDYWQYDLKADPAKLAETRHFLIGHSVALPDVRLSLVAPTLTAA